MTLCRTIYEDFDGKKKGTPGCGDYLWRADPQLKHRLRVGASVSPSVYAPPLHPNPFPSGQCLGPDPALSEQSTQKISNGPGPTPRDLWYVALSSPAPRLVGPRDIYVSHIPCFFLSPRQQKHYNLVPPSQLQSLARPSGTAQRTDVHTRSGHVGDPQVMLYGSRSIPPDHPILDSLRAAGELTALSEEKSKSKYIRAFVHEVVGVVSELADGSGCLWTEVKTLDPGGSIPSFLVNKAHSDGVAIIKKNP